MHPSLPVVFVLLSACGGKGEEDKSLDLAGANAPVIMAAVKVFASLDSLGSAQGPESIALFGKVVATAAALHKELTDAKRETVGGKLKACADGWYKAADDLKAALAPIAADAGKGPEKGRELEYISNLQNAWESSGAKAKLCALKDAGAACTEAMKGTTNKMNIMDIGHVCP